MKIFFFSKITSISSGTWHLIPRPLKNNMHLIWYPKSNFYIIKLYLPFLNINLHSYPVIPGFYRKLQHGEIMHLKILFLLVAAKAPKVIQFKTVWATLQKHICLELLADNHHQRICLYSLCLHSGPVGLALRPQKGMHWLHWLDWGQRICFYQYFLFTFSD